MPLPGPDPRLFPITACIWDTHLIVCCLILSVQVWTAPLFCLCPCISISTLTLSLFSRLWERAPGATFTWLQIVQEKQLKVIPKPHYCAAPERDSPSEPSLWKHSWWAQIRFHWWRRTRRAIVTALVVLSELRGNQSDFSPALRQINRKGIWNKAPRIFMNAEEVCEECGHGRWPLCISK